MTDEPPKTPTSTKGRACLGGRGAAVSQVYRSGRDQDCEGYATSKEIGEVRWYVAVLLDHNFNELFFFVPYEEPATTLRLFAFCIAGGR